MNDPVAEQRKGSQSSVDCFLTENRPVTVAENDGIQAFSVLVGRETVHRSLQPLLRRR